MGERMKKRKDTLSYELKRVVNFLRIFSRSRRGIIGVGLLVFFTILALAAPLLSPYHPTLDTYLAGSAAIHARPVWLRYLPGGETLSENLNPVTDPGLTSPSSLGVWDFTSNSSNVYIQYAPSIGYSKPGCAAIIYERNAGIEPTRIKATLGMKFNYPYAGPPAWFLCNVAALVEGAENAPVEISVFIEDTKDKRYDWGLGYEWDIEDFTSTSTKWITPSPPIASTASVVVVIKRFGQATDLGKVIEKTGEYTFGIDIIFKEPQANRDKQVMTTVYLDNLNIQLYGTAFGLLGTDYAGRDLLSQLTYGARISLVVGLLSAVLSVVIGLLFGLIAGYLVGVVDEVIMRFTDVMLVLPGLPLLIALIAVLGSSMWNLIMIIGLLGWMGFARLVRSQVLSLKERPYIEAVKAIGAGKFYIMFRHILPNVMSLVYVSLALAVPTAIVSEAALSFLGYYDPYVMSWGRMLYDVQNHSGYADWWWIIPPGICIAAVSISFILLGYALDEILNPKLRIRR